jgi:hypothetical protein
MNRPGWNEMAGWMICLLVTGDECKAQVRACGILPLLNPKDERGCSISCCMNSSSAVDDMVVKKNEQTNKQINKPLRQNFQLRVRLDFKYLT